MQNAIKNKSQSEDKPYFTQFELLELHDQLKNKSIKEVRNVKLILRTLNRIINFKCVEITGKFHCSFKRNRNWAAKK